MIHEGWNGQATPKLYLSDFVLGGGGGKNIQDDKC